jgi:Uma2 family endonuclease
MTSEEFIAWAMDQPETAHFELVGGEVVAMAPERLGHVRAKQRIFLRLAEAIARHRLPCEALIDGAAIQVDASTVYEPDVLVRCGDALSDDTVNVTDPMIIVEVASPSTHRVDRGVKFIDYFRIATVRHYLLVFADRRVILHHVRDKNGLITSHILGDGPIRLEPPGIELSDILPRPPETGR